MSLLRHCVIQDTTRMEQWSMGMEPGHGYPRVPVSVGMCHCSTHQCRVDRDWCVHCTVPVDTRCCHVNMAGNRSSDHFQGMPHWVTELSLPPFVPLPSSFILCPPFLLLPAECTPIPYCAQTVCTGPLSSRCVRCQAALPSGLPLVLSRSGRRCRGECDSTHLCTHSR